MQRLHPPAGRAGVAAALIAALALTGCTSSSGNQPAPTSTGASSTSTSTSSSASASKSPTVPNGGLPAGVTQGPLPSTVANNITKRKSVTPSICKASSDGWTAGGTVKNSSDARETFHITVFFTTTQATVLSYARTTVTVRKGATKNWSASAKFKAPKTMLCVLRGVG